jgi:PAS domain S-box-containing protein
MPATNAVALAMTRRFEKPVPSLSAHAARLEQLAGALGDMISAYDRECRYLEVSAGVTGLLGYRPQDLEGSSALELVHPEDAVRVREVHARVLDGAEETVSYRFRRADGKYVWLETLLRPVRHGEQVAEVVCASREVTEREVGRLATDENRRQMHRQIEFVLRERLINPVVQPIVDLEAHRVIGYEALARFPAIPTRPPNVWFEHAAAVGLGVELELLAVERALLLLDELPDDVYVSVNVSPATLNAPGLQDIASTVAPTRLVVELTEHTPIDDYRPLNAAMMPLRERGVRLAVDDAGAGFASLRHILDMRPDIIKLDMALTRHVHTDAAHRALARALCQFSAALDATVVAEGIEEQAQVDALRALDISVGQGYLLGAPGPPPDREAVVAR